MATSKMWAERLRDMETYAESAALARCLKYYDDTLTLDEKERAKAHLQKCANKQASQNASCAESAALARRLKNYDGTLTLDEKERAKAHLQQLSCKQ